MVTFTSADPFTPFENLLNAITADSTAKDTLITNVRQIKSYKWANVAARNAQTGMTEGDIGDQADTDVTYRYNGTAWKSSKPGMIPVVPTSVSGTGVSLGIGGMITFTGASYVSVNGCFTAEFDNYLVYFNINSSSVASGGILQLQAAGVPNAAALYTTKRLYAQDNAAMVSDLLASLAAFNPVPVAGTEHTSRWEFTGPAIASRMTRLHITADTWGGSGTSAVEYQGAGRHNVAAAFDGFVYTPSTGAITGEARIYGYNNG